MGTIFSHTKNAPASPAAPTDIVRRAASTSKPNSASSCFENKPPNQENIAANADTEPMNSTIRRRLSAKLRRLSARAATSGSRISKTVAMPTAITAAISKYVCCHAAYT